MLIGVDRGGRDQVWALNPEFSPLEPIPPVYQAQDAETTGNTRRGGGYPGSDRPLRQRITVNGRTTEVTFPPTGWWGTWERRDILAPLRAGKHNTLTLIAEDGGPHIDKLKINSR